MGHHRVYEIIDVRAVCHCTQNPILQCVLIFERRGLTLAPRVECSIRKQTQHRLERRDAQSDSNCYRGAGTKVTVGDCSTSVSGRMYIYIIDFQPSLSSLQHQQLVTTTAISTDLTSTKCLLFQNTSLHVTQSTPLFQGVLKLIS